MRRITVLIIAGFGLAAAGQDPESSHAAYFEHYQGTKTCLQCHSKEAENFFHSQHYQWQGVAPNIVNAAGRRLGKLNTVNDFCTNPQANWIGFVRNKSGDVLSRGCSACHAGYGKVPSPVMSDDQLQNIDCLMCHASGYRRDLYADDQGRLEWKPILWKNTEGLDSVAKRISLPTRTMCLRCHSASGGGPNFKRGDLEYVLKDPERDYDVHMASNGKNMQCISCHAGQDHRVRGRGADLSGTDMPENPLGCASSGCHAAQPHKAEILNQHVERVNCTVCHIPAFARTEPTDMVRDWSHPVYHPEQDKYTADIRLEKNVKPVYAWYNGKTRETLLGEPVQRLSDGSVGMMVPQGSRSDPKARIFAFKLHRGRLPVLSQRNWIVPIVVEEFFSEGKIDPAVKKAAQQVYGIEDAQYTWTETTRYMGIFHGVQPASKAVQCLECHGPNGRMDWKALGYGRDPILAHRPQKAEAKARTSGRMAKALAPKTH